MRTRVARLALAGALALGASLVLAGPLDQGAIELDKPDPYELATRWTMAALGASGNLGPTASVEIAPAPLPPAWSPFAGLTAQGSNAKPEPGPYALLGVLLLAAGLLGSRFLRR